MHWASDCFHFSTPPFIFWTPIYSVLFCSISASAILSMDLQRYAPPQIPTEGISSYCHKAEIQLQETCPRSPSITAWETTAYQWNACSSTSDTTGESSSSTWDWEEHLVCVAINTQWFLHNISLTKARLWLTCLLVSELTNNSWEYG